MNEPTPPIAGQAARLTTSRVHDADQTTLVCVVHLDTKPAYAECSAVARDGTSRQLGRSPSDWRVDSASAEAFDDGTVRFWLSCWPDEQSGTQAAVRWIDFPGAVKPLPRSAVDVDARWQAKQAQHVANAAWTGVQALDGRVDVLEG